ncbi:hypothetical protein GCM10025786_30170 [Nocardioides caeni]
MSELVSGNDPDGDRCAVCGRWWREHGTPFQLVVENAAEGGLAARLRFCGWHHVRDWVASAEPVGIESNTGLPSLRSCLRTCLVVGMVLLVVAVLAVLGVLSLVRGI